MNKRKNQRLTGLYALRRLSAARATKKRSRAYALCTFFLRHIFCALELLRNSFIAHKKRRIQPKRYAPVYPLIYAIDYISSIYELKKKVEELRF
jgi:hypothetical protein